MKPNLIIFCNTNSVFTSNILLNSFFKLHLENEISVLAVIETGSLNSEFTLANRIKRILSLVLNLRTVNTGIFDELSYSVKGLCEKNKINYHVPSGKNINSQEFLKELKTIKDGNEVSALVLGCPQIFKKELIAEFQKIINYHDSYLPAFRGLNATAWSRYEQKEFSGYTFHLINEKIDDGEIIYQELLPVKQDWNIHQHICYKAREARKAATHIVKYLSEGSYNNTGKKKYSSDRTFYSNKMKQELINNFYKINKTSESYSLQKRLIERSFGLKL